MVAKGFPQVHGQDHFEVYAPVGRHVSLRAIIAHAIIRDQDIEQTDVSTAFMNADLEEAVYMSLPPSIKARRIRDNMIETYLDFEQPNSKTNFVALLRKSVNGLKQSGRNWSHELHNTLTSIGFKRSLIDSCLYSWSKPSGVLWLVVFVDDMVYTGNKEHIKEFKHAIEQRYKVARETTH